MRRHKIKLKKCSAEVLIINLTGVLTDCGWTYHHKAISEAFGNKGIKIKDKIIIDTCGLPVYQQIVKILNNKGILSEWIKNMKIKPDQNIYNELALAVNTKIIEAINQSDYIMFDLNKKLNKLFKKGYKIVLASEYSRDTSALIEEKLKENAFNFHKLYSYSDFKASYPHPFLCYQAATDFNIFPMESFIRVGDTQYHNLEAFYAGVWAVSILKTGVFSGLNKYKLKKKGILKSDKKIKSISKKLKKSGAHYTINTLDEIMWVIEDINYRLSRHELPNCLF